MAQSVKLSDEIMAFIRKEADLQSRSVAGQITHWVNIGRAIEHSSAFDYRQITALLAAEIDTPDLAAEEEKAWLDTFVSKMAEPTDKEHAFFAELQRLGRGVGLDAAGNLVYAKDSPPV